MFWLGKTLAKCTYIYTHSLPFNDRVWGLVTSIWTEYLTIEWIYVYRTNIGQRENWSVRSAATYPRLMLHVVSAIAYPYLVLVPTAAWINLPWSCWLAWSNLSFVRTQRHFKGNCPNNRVKSILTHGKQKKQVKREKVNQRVEEGNLRSYSQK